MAEYIEREALVPLMEYVKCSNGNGNCKNCFGDWDCGGSCQDHAKTLIADIYNRPAIEVVYCADCQWHTANGCQNPRIEMSDGAKLYMYPSDYCSYGERKGGEG